MPSKHARFDAHGRPLTRAVCPKYHGELGAFFNYTRLANSSTNFYGVGGRVGFNVHPNLQLEGEFSYDFQQNLNNDFFSNNGVLGVIITNSTLHMIHGLFGPNLQIGTGAFRVFGTVKGGLINFSTSSSFPTQVTLIWDGDTDGVFYPGGGVELYAGPLGIRAEIGDEMWFSHGTNHNLRITVGPQIRF
jgi:hypothetical protein